MSRRFAGAHISRGWYPLHFQATERAFRKAVIPTISAQRDDEGKRRHRLIKFHLT